MRDTLISAWLIFRKDLLYTRSLVAIWAVALLLPLVLAITGPESVWEGTRFIKSEWIGGMLSLLFVIIVTLLPNVVILEDSRARQERFLNSRPVNRQGVRLGKVVYLAIVFVVPVFVQEFLLGYLQGVDLSWATLIQRPLLVAGWVAMVASVATLASNGFHLILKWGMVLVGCSGLMKLLSMVESLRPQVQWLFRAEDLLIVLIPQVGLMFVVAVVLLGFLWRPTGRVRPFACALLALVAVLVAVGTPWRGFTKRAADQEGIAEAWTAWQKSNPKRWALDSFSSSGSSFKADLRMRALSEPPKWNLNWRARRGALVSNDRELELGTINELVSINAQSRREQQGLSSVLRRELDQEMIVMNTQSMIVSSPDDSSLMRSIVNSDRLEAADREEPRTIQWDLEANVHTWRLVANMPLALSERAEDSGRKWTVLGIHRRSSSRSEWTIGLRCQLSQGPLQTGKPELAYLLYVPERKLALTLKGSWSESIDRLSAFSAVGDQWLNLRDPRGSAVFSEIPANARLLICEAHYQGKIVDQWRSPSLVLRDFVPREIFIRNGGGRERMSEKDLLEAFRALEAPSADADSSIVRGYLAKVLDLTTSHDIALVPIVEQLALYVPEHVGLMFQALRGSHERPRRFLIQALIVGSLDTQKEEVLRELGRQLALTDVVIARGWETDAKEVLFAQLERGQYSSRSVGVLASLEDSRHLPLLLDTLEDDPWNAAILIKASSFRDAVIERWTALVQARDRAVVEEAGYHDLVIVGVRWGDRLTLAQTQRRLQALPKDSHEGGYWDNVRSVIVGAGREVLEDRPLEDFVWNALTQKFELKP